MANKFNLGLNLGQMLAGTMDKTNSQKGYLDGMRAIVYQTSADLNRAKVGETESNTALKTRQFELQSDDALKRVARLNQGFSDGMEIPQDKMSDNNKQMANLLFAVGADNKSLDLQKMTQGIQRNNITADLTPQNAYEKSLQASALEPNVNPLEIRKATLTDSIANSGAPNANENALLLSQGKEIYGNMQDRGTFNKITGENTVNDIGRSVVTKNSTTKPNDLKFDSKTGTIFNSSTGEIKPATMSDGGAIAREKPLERPLAAPLVKLQDDHLEAISTAGGISNHVKEFQRKIDSKELDLGLMANLTNKAQGFLGVSDAEAVQLADFQAYLEKMRNDSLILNKGVQTDGDATRAWNALIKNINDPKIVKFRLNEIAGYNERAVKERKLRVNVLRKNNNLEPMDFAPFDSLDTLPATNSKATQPAGASAPMDEAKKAKYAAWKKAQGK